MIRRVVFQVIAFTFVILVAVFAMLPVSADISAQPLHADSPYDLIDAVNALRASYGLAAYSINSILMYTAQSQADFMASTGDVTHTGAGGSSVTERLLAAGYPLAGDLSLGGFRSENITGGLESKTAQDTINGWTGDAPHLNTMISPNLTEIGAGVAVANGRVYYVIDCALPTTSGIPQGSEQTSNGGTVIPGELSIPVVVLSTPDATGKVIHEVLPGQTLWQIAIAYNVKIAEIRNLNGLLGDSIYPGDALVIKLDQAVVTETPAALPTEVVTATFTPIVTITSISPTIESMSTPAASATMASTEPSSVIAYVIGLIALAVLAGGYFAWLGNSKTDST